MELERVLEAFEQPRTRENLERAYLESPPALLATFLWGRSGLERWVGEAPLITDERPLMEFFRHQGGNMRDRDIATLLVVPQADWSWLRGREDHPDLVESLRRENRALRLYVESTVRISAQMGIEAARLSRATEFFLYRFGCASEQLARLESEVGGGSETVRHLQRCRALASGGANR
jgi:hypothetical protein